jgi:hypothetical protein
MRISRTGFSLSAFDSDVEKVNSRQAKEAEEKIVYLVIPSEARNLSFFSWGQIEERFLASLGMTKGVGPFFRSL